MKKLYLLLSILLLVFHFSFGQSSPGNQKKISNQAQADTPTWEILVDNQSMEKNGIMTSLVVVYEKDASSFVEATFLVKKDRLPTEDSFIFTLNKEIEIRMGYRHENRTVFLGRVVSQRITQFHNEPHTCIVRCESRPDRIVASVPDSSPVVNLMYGANILEFDLTINQEASIEGMIAIQGLPEPFLGKRIQLNGFAAVYNRVVKVLRVEHILDKRGWKTSLHVRSNAPEFASHASGNSRWARRFSRGDAGPEYESGGILLTLLREQVEMIREPGRFAPIQFIPEQIAAIGRSTPVGKVDFIIPQDLTRRYIRGENEIILCAERVEISVIPISGSVSVTPVPLPLPNPGNPVSAPFHNKEADVGAEYPLPVFRDALPDRSQDPRGNTHKGGDVAVTPVPLPMPMPEQRGFISLQLNIEQLNHLQDGGILELTDEQKTDILRQIHSERIEIRLLEDMNPEHIRDDHQIGLQIENARIWLDAAPK